MTVNHPITIDLVQPGLTPRLYAMQHDANSRIIVFTLTQAGAPWEAPAGTIFGISYRKSDGTRGYYRENIVCTGATVCAAVAPQVLTCPGMVDAALVCNAADGSRIAAFPVQIQVRPDPAAGKTDSDDYFNPSDAVRYTPQTLTDAQKQQARANLGLTEAAADTWLYNGYALPPLPDWDKTAYPYALISYRKEDATYRLSVHSAIRYFQGAPNLVGHSYTHFGDKTPGTARLFTCQEGQAAWTLQENTYWSICVDGDMTVKDAAIWANFDLLDNMEDVYIMATEPMAAGPEAAGITLPYVPLMTQLEAPEEDGAIVLLSEAESRMLTAAARQGRPCVISAVYNGIPISLVAMLMRSDTGQLAFLAGVDTQYRMMLMQEEDAWMAMIEGVAA